MRRILAGVRGDSGVRGDAELERLIRGATDTAYDASALPPYSAPIQFAVQRVCDKLQEHNIAAECVRGLKAKIKGDRINVAANALCMLDALMRTSTTVEFRRQVVDRLLQRVCKMGLGGSRCTAPAVADRARSVLIGWGTIFPGSADILRAATAVRGEDAVHRPLLEVEPREDAVNQAALYPGRQDDDDDQEEDVPCAQARVPDSQAVSGIVLSSASQSGALQYGHAPPACVPRQSRFYLSALRAAEREAEKVRAEQEASDRAFALAARDSTALRPPPATDCPLPATGGNIAPVSTSHATTEAGAASFADRNRAEEGDRRAAGEMSEDACKEISDVFGSLLLDAPRDEAPGEVLALVSVRASRAHVRVQQLLHSISDVPDVDVHKKRLLGLDAILTQNLAIFTSLGQHGSNAPVRPLTNARIPLVETVETGKTDHTTPPGGSPPSLMQNLHASAPSMTTDELMDLLSASAPATGPRNQQDTFERLAKVGPSDQALRSSQKTGKPFDDEVNSDEGSGACQPKSSSMFDRIVRALDAISTNLEVAEEEVRIGQDEFLEKEAKLAWLSTVSAEAKRRIKGNADQALCALALQKKVQGWRFFKELQRLGDIPVDFNAVVL